MAVNRGETTSQFVQQCRLNIGAGGWTALQCGSDPLVNRRQIRVQIKAGVGGSMALEYANAVITNNSRGISSKSFTAPTTGASGTTTYPGNFIWVEPVGDNVTVYGRLVKKKGFTDNSITAIVTEYA